MRTQCPLPKYIKRNKFSTSKVILKMILKVRINYPPPYHFYAPHLYFSTQFQNIFPPDKIFWKFKINYFSLSFFSSIVIDFTRDEFGMS